MITRPNQPVTFTDKEISAVMNVTALAIVRANNGSGPGIPNLLSAVIKIQASQYEQDFELSEERLAILYD
jgi:hypothetical protein